MGPTHFPAEFFDGVVTKLCSHVPPGVKIINRANRELWWKQSRGMVCDALPPDELKLLHARLPRRRHGIRSSEQLDVAWVEKRRVQTKVAHAMQQIQRAFAVSRRLPRPPKGTSRSSTWRHKHAASPIQRMPDAITTLPDGVINGWLEDTSKITKPLLKGTGAPAQGISTSALFFSPLSSSRLQP